MRSVADPPDGRAARTSPALAQAAVAYYGAYYGEFQDEIDAEIALNQAEWERGRAAWEAGKKALDAA